MTLEERWAEDDKFGDAGLKPASERLSPVAEAISLAVNHDEREAWDRYLEVDLDDDDDVAAWHRWFERYRRERGFEPVEADSTPCADER